jgi:hypothetical protein
LPRGIKTSLLLRLQADGGRGDRTNLGKDASRKRIRDREHDDHHVNVYLPRHRGVKWDRR